MGQLLLPLAWLYAWVNRGRALSYRLGLLKPRRLPGKVFSVGNIEVGGTGKSPVVVALCQALKAQGASPVILTRGYRSGLKKDESAVLKGESIILEATFASHFQADEARMQAAQLEDVPVVIGSRRYAAAQRYLAHFPAPSHWILDDGFQHLMIARDCDIVLLDAQAPLGNGWCLPAGRLRESPQALRRAQFLLFTRAQFSTELSFPSGWPRDLRLPLYRVQFRDGTPLQKAGPSTPIHEVKRWTVALGIARPERLIETLKRSGLPLGTPYLVGDHVNFDFARILSILSPNGAILTTEKDYWRARSEFQRLDCPVFILPLELQWEDPSALSNIVDSFT